MQATQKRILFAALSLLVLAQSACEEDVPSRFVTNERHGNFVEWTHIPDGRITVVSPDRISVAIDRLAVISVATGFAYEGNLTFIDSTSTRVDIPTGRFSVVATGGPDPAHRTGDIRFTYERTGAFQVIAGTGDELGQGQPLPPGIDFTDSLTFYLAVDVHPDTSASPGFIHVLVAEEDFQNPNGPVDLIVPVNLGLPGAGDFSNLDGEASLSAATGGFQLQFRQMPVLTRTAPPDDIGLIYQAWFVDLDQNPYRYQSITRFVPNQVGDRIIDGSIHPGDLDQDGTPEPLDFEWVVISIEPDALNAQQPVGQGADTSGDIFPLFPYFVRLPLTHQ